MTFPLSKITPSRTTAGLTLVPPKSTPIAVAVLNANDRLGAHRKTDNEDEQRKDSEIA
jgi:hypothetical protein